jgi:hypothetical protein
VTVAPIGIQRRMMELGVVRFGEKGPKGAPRKLDHFRLTSASEHILQAAATEYGGTVRPWEGAPNEGTYELHTETAELPIVIPPVYADTDGQPTYPFSQWYELWSGGGCKRRCDGRDEVISAGPCLCDPDSRECDIVTRVRFILPDLPGIGLWRLNTGGYNAAVELPATLEFLAAQAGQGTYLQAVLRLEQRMSKKDGTTRRFAVPVIDVPELRVRDMLPGATITTPPAVERGRPAIPAGPSPPAVPEATTPEDIPFGEPVGLESHFTDEALREAGVSPVGGDTVEFADLEDRRNIFKVKTDRGVSDERLKELLVQVTGQDSTSAIPKALVDVVITCLLAEEVAP